MDAGRAPEWIGEADLADQIPDFLGNSWSAGDAAGLQSPECPEAPSVPADNSLGPNDDDRAQKVRPQSI